MLGSMGRTLRFLVLGLSLCLEASMTAIISRTGDTTKADVGVRPLSATRDKILQKITVRYTENLIVDQGRSS